MALVWSRHGAGVDLPGAGIEQVQNMCGAGVDLHGAGVKQVQNRCGAGVALHGEGREPPPCAALPGGDAVCTQ